MMAVHQEMSIGAESFRQLSPSEFFYRNREIAGFSNPGRALYQTVREFVENSLDATEVHGILPTIVVQIRREDPHNPNYFTVTVEDNGIGIPNHIVPDAFGRVLYSSKYKYRQTRGMYGLGAKMAILYGQLTTGKPFEIYTSTPRSSKIYYYKLLIDIRRNEPIVLERGSWRKNSGWHGTIARVTIEGDWKKRIRDYIVVYIRRTAIIAPYADLTLAVPQIVSQDPREDGVEIIHYPRATTKLPSPPKEAKPHPLGIDLELLKMMIADTRHRTLKEFLTKSFQRIGDKKALEILRKSGLEPSRNPKTLTSTELKRLYKVMRHEKYLSPSSHALSPIGADLIKIGLKQVLKPEFVEAVTRRPGSYGGHPFIIEAGIAYGGKLTEMMDEISRDALKSQSGPYIVLLRYANKIPLLYDEKADVMWSVVSPDSFNWRTTYKLDQSDVVAVLIHIASTKVPYKGVGKESVAPIDEVKKEMEAAVQELARKLRTYISRKRRLMEAEQKYKTFLKYIPEVSRSLAVIAGDGLGGPDETLMKRIEEKLKRLAEKKVRLIEQQAEA
jgi:DNA topoisomerase-6 subunit B